MKTVIPQSEFQEMKYDPTIKGKIISTYSELHHCFHKVSDKLARWVIAVFSEDSPIHEKESNFQKKQDFASEEVGITITEKTLSEDDVLDAIHNYLEFCDNELWQLIISNTLAFNEYQRLIRLPLVSTELDKKTLDAATVKTKLLSDSHDTRIRLKSYRKEFYGDDELDRNQKKRKRIRPERVQEVQ